MRIASWNVNSVRARIEPVTKWIAKANPDVLLLQELKGTEFPAAYFKELGYESVAVTQKSYNGVAVISRSPIELLGDTLKGDVEDSHARFLDTRIDGIRIINIYLPNGNPVGTDKFLYKLAWMDRLLAVLSELAAIGESVLIGGDFNVIPEDIDCHKPESWMQDALFQPETRARYRALLAMGYVDAFRSLHPAETGQFTYWDYFRQAFERNRGVRIDHFLISQSVAGRLKSCEIDKEPRGLEKPSDHTPILLELS